MPIQANSGPEEPPEHPGGQRTLAFYFKSEVAVGLIGYVHMFNLGVISNNRGTFQVSENS